MSDEIDKNLDVLFQYDTLPVWVVDKFTYDELKHDPYFKPMCGDEALGVGDS